MRSIRLSHPVGALYDTHHGMTNAVFMPYVLQFNRAAIEQKFDRWRASSEFRAAYQGVLRAILKLRSDLDVPHTLAGLNVDDSKRELIADMAIVDPTAGGNLVELTKEGALEIFDKAQSGVV